MNLETTVECCYSKVMCLGIRLKRNRSMIIFIVNMTGLESLGKLVSGQSMWVFPENEGFVR